MGYLQNIAVAIRTLWQGIMLTGKHLREAISKPRQGNLPVSHANYFHQHQGIVTLQYPKEQFPVPEIGRYKLHNQIEDCIVCDKCAKICPVNCIEIEAIKAPQPIGKASDGTPIRLYAARFDIDMAKCCFCGLCTTVCPTECLTMTPEYDFSVYHLEELTFKFSKMTPEEIAQRRAEALEQETMKKKSTSESQTAEKHGAETDASTKPAARPKFVVKRPPTGT
ncbi:MAG: 4Fe-4S binding protein [Cytophagales bacterium]|nr:4Fe-4S binding protein [Bernardetiaceae bacterium]MDW8210721.1 4Fe-4S binding protein [Cytophagales bacterium]